MAHREQGRLAHERRRLSDAEVEALRADVRERLAAEGRSRVVEREGRVGLVVGQTLVGLLHHGWAIPVAFDIDSDRGAVATYLLTSGASFLVPYLATRDAPVSVAQRDAFFWGATKGDRLRGPAGRRPRGRRPGPGGRRSPRRHRLLRAPLHHGRLRVASGR